MLHRSTPRIASHHGTAVPQQPLNSPVLTVKDQGMYVTCVVICNVCYNWNSNYNDGDSTTASMATTATSKDEWEGLTQPQPPVIDDSVCICKN